MNKFTFFRILLITASLFLFCAQHSHALKDVSVREFGARGNEHTDDTAAFQKALDTVISEGGGRIIVPGGDYIISERLTVIVPNEKIKSDAIRVAIVGQGPTKSRLMSKSTDGLLHFETAGTRMDVTVRDIALMAQKPDAGTALRIQSRLGGVRVERAAVIERVLISGIYDDSYFTEGLSVSGNWRPLMRDIDIRGAKSESLEDDSPAFAMKKGIRMDAFYGGRIVNCHVRYCHTAYSWVAAANGEGFIVMDSTADFVRVGAVISTPEQEPGGDMKRTLIKARDYGIIVDHKRLLFVTENTFEPLAKDGEFPFVDVAIYNSWAIQVNNNKFLGSPKNRTHILIDGASEKRDYVVMPFTRFIQANSNQFSLPIPEAIQTRGQNVFGIYSENNHVK